jgi:ATP-dependent Clp protease ATP-binding subunit ClpA
MFERYSEEARQVIFSARYEAINFGSPYIEAEHLLLALMREDRWLTRLFLPAKDDVSKIRSTISSRLPRGEKLPASVDLPLSNESKRILAYAAEEAERLGDRHIGTEHLFLGVLHEEKSLLAELLFERGIKLEDARRTIKFRNSAGKEGIGASGSQEIESGPAFGNARVIISRWIEFQNEADESSLGTTMALDVPRIGEEVVISGTRARVTRVTYHYEPKIPADRLVPQKIVVSVQVL